MARADLADIIAQVNTLLGNATWFSDDEIQSALDRHRFEHRYTRLNALAYFGADQQMEYRIWEAPTYLEAPVITDLDYAAVTFETVDYINGRLERNEDLGKQYILLSGFEHDVYSAAADLLDIRAAQKAEDLTSFSGVNGSYSKALTKESLESKAENYRKRAKVRGGDYEAFQVINLVRDDHC